MTIRSSNDMHDYIKGNVYRLRGIEKTEDTFCPFDAFTPKCNFEYKCRHTHYDDTIIEADKLERNYKIAVNEKKLFFYVVYSGGSIYFFNINKLVKDGYDFRFEFRRMPVTTEFSRRSYIEKLVGYLPWDQAQKVIEVKDD